MNLENNEVLLTINLNGGAYSDFHFKDSRLNPISFVSMEPGQANAMGHLLCFDRWGPPTEAEKANGFLHHGEANSQVWEKLSESQTIDGLMVSAMMCRLPLAGLQLTRKIGLSENEPVFFVKEEIKNLNKYGRMYNIVQHVTIAPPFLDTTTIFDNNTEKGFENKEDGRMNQEEPVLQWPDADYNGVKVSLRNFQHEWPRVSSFVYSQNNGYGWVTASNPSKNLMLGYLWEIKDYPWINFWRSMENGVPRAFGMEFGTTGLHEPFPVVAKKGKIFDRNIYDFIDAGEIITKCFAGFLARIPQDYQGVESIEVSDDLLIIKERSKVPRDIIYHNKLNNPM